MQLYFLTVTHRSETILLASGVRRLDVRRMIIRKLTPDKLNIVEKTEKQSFCKILWSICHYTFSLYHSSLTINNFQNHKT